MSIKYPNGDVKWTNGEQSQVQGRGPDWRFTRELRSSDMDGI